MEGGGGWREGGVDGVDGGRGWGGWGEWEGGWMDGSEWMVRFGTVRCLGYRTVRFGWVSVRHGKR